MGGGLPAKGWLPGEMKSCSVLGEGTEQGGVFPACQGLLYTEAEGEGETSHLVSP